MAGTTGTFCSSVYTDQGIEFHRCVKVFWKSTNNPTNNSSFVEWDAYVEYSPNDSLKEKQTSASHYRYKTVNVKQVKVTIDGVTQTLVGDTEKQTYEGTYLGGGTTTVFHNSDGTKSVDVSISAKFYEYNNGDNAIYSGSINMKNNPMIILTKESPVGGNIIINRTSINGVNSTGTDATGEIDGDNSTGVLCIGDTLKITATPNSGYTLSSLTVNNNDFGSGSTHTVSGDVTVNATFQSSRPMMFAMANASSQPSAPTITATDATIGLIPSMISFSKGEGTYATLQISFPALNGSVAGNLTRYLDENGELQLNPVYISSARVLFWVPGSEFYSRIPNNISGICTINLRSYAGNNSSSLLKGTATCDFTVHTSENICKPTISSAYISPSTPTRNEPVTCYLSATAANSANIKYKYVNGIQFSGGSYTFSNATAGEYVFKVEDTRGYTATYTIKPDYSIPFTCHCRAKTKRGIISGKTVNLYIYGKADCNENLSIGYRIKKKGDSYSSSYTPISISNITRDAANNSYEVSDYTISSLQQDYEYNIEIRATLNGNSKTVEVSTISLPFKVFDYNADNFNLYTDLVIDSDEPNEYRNLYVSDGDLIVGSSSPSDRGFVQSQHMNTGDITASNYYLKDGYGKEPFMGNWTELGAGYYNTNNTSGSTEPLLGHNGAGIYYRIVGGNHVYICANVQVSVPSQGAEIQLCSLPDNILPKTRKIPYSICAASGSRIARCHVEKQKEDGDPGNNPNENRKPEGLYLDWVIDLSNNSIPTNIGWCDLYIDYFI